MNLYLIKYSNAFFDYNDISYDRIVKEKVSKFERVLRSNDIVLLSLEFERRNE